jgi:N-acetylglucosamine-6-phosphate deacetylase
MIKKETITVCGIPVGGVEPITCAIQDGSILWIEKDSKIKEVDFGDEETIIAPLLLDAQVNGGFGITIQDENLNEEKLLTLSQKLHQLGIVRWIPTIVTTFIEKTIFLCRTIANSLRNKELSFAIPGIHLEGPWISPEDGPRGAHPIEHIRKPSRKEWEKYYQSAEGKILYVTLAPEQKKCYSVHLLSCISGDKSITWTPQRRCFNYAKSSRSRCNPLHTSGQWNPKLYSPP